MIPQDAVIAANRFGSGQTVLCRYEVRNSNAQLFWANRCQAAGWQGRSCPTIVAVEKTITAGLRHSATDRSDLSRLACKFFGPLDCGGNAVQKRQNGTDFLSRLWRCEKV